MHGMHVCFLCMCTCAGAKFGHGCAGSEMVSDLEVKVEVLGGWLGSCLGGAYADSDVSLCVC
jgi:hypothetical protein